MSLVRYLLRIMLTGLCFLAMIFAIAHTQCYGQAATCTVLGASLQQGENMDTVLTKVDGHPFKKNQHQVPSLEAKNSKEEMDDFPWDENDEGQSAETFEKLPWEGGREQKEEPSWEKEIPEQKSALSFSGSVWNKFGVDIHEDSPYEDDMCNHAELLLEGVYSPSFWLTALLSVELQHFTYVNDGHWESDFDPDVFDAYVDLSGSIYHLRIGQQIVKWGKADEIGPLDIVNPEDFRDGPLRPRDERKLPIPMINLELFKGLYKLQTIYIPFFKKSKLDFKGDDWAIFDHYKHEVGHFQIVKDDVAKTLDNGEFGVRGSGTVRNFDYAFSYFYTRSDLPALETMSVSHLIPLPVSDATFRKLAQLSAMLNQPINISYDRLSVTGFEFETTLGGFGLRGEAGYFNKMPFFTETLQKVRKPVFQYALGLDYSGQETWYLNLQFLQSIVIHYEDNLLFSHKTTNSAFGKITKGLLDDKLELSLRAYYNFTDHDYYWNPSATVKYWEDITFELGADIVGGAMDTTMGLFRENDQLYVILRCFF